MTPEREEALRRVDRDRHVQHVIGELDGWRKDVIAALAADLEAAERFGHDMAALAKVEQAGREAAERERDEYRDSRRRQAAGREAAEDRDRLTIQRAIKAERDLATAREALENIADEENHTSEARRIARAALRSLDGEPTTQASAGRSSGEAMSPNKERES